MLYSVSCARPFWRGGGGAMATQHLELVYMYVYGVIPFFSLTPHADARWLFWEI